MPALLGIFLAGSAGCQAEELGCAATARCCVAVSDNFRNYQQWERFDLNAEPNVVHEAGRHRVYLNRRPPPGATRFPQGTILLKTVEVSATDVDYFAMVQRGCDFNPANDGWEFLRLVADANGQLLIPSGGRGPDNAVLQGMGYSDNPTGAATRCIDCHGTSARATDHVLGTGLSPSNLASGIGPEAGAPADAASEGGSPADAGADASGG